MRFVGASAIDAGGLPVSDVGGAVEPGDAMNDDSPSFADPAWSATSESFGTVHSFDRIIDETDRVEESYSSTVRRYINGSLMVEESTTDMLMYRSSGSGLIFNRVERDNGIVRTRPITVTPALYVGWADFGSSYTPPRAHKDADGYVHLDGLVLNTSGAIKTAPSLLSLPYVDLGGTKDAPQFSHVFAQQTSLGSRRVDVVRYDDPTYGIIAQVVVQVDIPISGWVSISGMTWFAGH